KRALLYQLSYQPNRAVRRTERRKVSEVHACRKQDFRRTMIAAQRARGREGTSEIVGGAHFLCWATLNSGLMRLPGISSAICPLYGARFRFLPYCRGTP